MFRNTNEKTIDRATGPAWGAGPRFVICLLFVFAVAGAVLLHVPAVYADTEAEQPGRQQPAVSEEVQPAEDTGVYEEETENDPASPETVQQDPDRGDSSPVDDTGNGEQTAPEDTSEQVNGEGGTADEPPEEAVAETVRTKARSFILGGNRVSFQGDVYTDAFLPSIARPYQLKLTAQPQGRFLLEWTNCRQLGAHIDGYIILRKAGNETGYTEIGRVGRDRNYCYDGHVSNNKTYCYIVVGYENGPDGAVTISHESMSVAGVTYNSTKTNPYAPVINRTTATIPLNGTVQLSLKYPAGSLSTWTRWRSDNTGIATVSSTGKVTGHKAGNVWISARTPNGRDVRCLVTVLNSTIVYKVVKARISDGLTMTSSGSFTFHGRLLDSSTGKVSVALDDSYLTGFYANGTNWTYTLDLSKLSYGWHYFYVAPQDKVTDAVKRSGHGIFINKPAAGGPAMIVPEDIVKQARTENNDQKRRYQDLLGAADPVYSAMGRYGLGTASDPDGEVTRFDSRGIIQVKIDGVWVYHPTTISQYALEIYDPAWASMPAEKRPDEYYVFLRYAIWLADNVGSDGAVHLPFTNRYLGTTLQPGHTSGMTQGQVLSVLGRAYQLSGSNKYLTAGERCLSFMVKQNTSTNTAAFNGCSDTLRWFAALDPALAKYKNLVIPEEVLVRPQVYILNGDLFAIQGLYDWSVLAKGSNTATAAKTAFDQGLKAVEAMLPYYDFYGYSAYDLRQWTTAYETRFTSGYAHACHITVLKQLYDVTGSKICYNYYRVFKAYADDPFYRQISDMYRK